MRHSLIILIFASLSLHAELSLRQLPELARQSIEAALHDKRPNRKEWVRKLPWLEEKGAVFVTLTKHGRLRGCIGSLNPQRRLYEDVVHNAKAAALNDSRFDPVTYEELKDLEIEVSVLRPPYEVLYEDIKDLKRKIFIGKDGIILQHGWRRATFLPQVWEQLPKFNDFFAALCDKAGLTRQCLDEHPRIWRYQVTKIKDTKKSIRKMSRQGTFYPATCEKMTSTFQKFAKRHQHVNDMTPGALVVPHAGYVFSGETAYKTYASASHASYKRIVVLGPSHHVGFRGISGSFHDLIQTPCGSIKTDKKFLESIDRLFDVRFVPKAHEVEHSTEVQFPLIRHFWPNTPVVELIYGNVSEIGLTQLILHLLRDPGTLLVLSTDLSHFYSQADAIKLDRHCIDGVLRNDHTLLKTCEACGKNGMIALVNATNDRQWKWSLIDYRTSAEAFGETSRVVGYMGMNISRSKSNLDK